MNDNFLDHSVKDFSLEGYALVTRRDRHNKQMSGIAAVELTETAERIKVVLSSKDAEKSLVDGAHQLWTASGGALVPPAEPRRIWHHRDFQNRAPRVEGIMRWHDRTW